MALDIHESDWKLFRQLHPVALERFCERVLAEVGRLASDPSPGAHRRYLAVYQLLRKRDRELAEAFDDFRRSTTLVQLAVLRSRGLVTDEEFARFSPEAQNAVRVLSGMSDGE